MKKIYLFILLFLLSLANLFSDGLIVIDPQPTISTPFPLEVRYHHVDIKINNNIAETDIDQIFYNPTSRSLEGYYIFPIPKGAVFKKFSMYINGKEASAELLDANKARKIYEDIVRKQLDPALLEYDGRELYKVRIFPIDPRGEKRVKISYTEILNKDSGTYQYMYPLNTEKFSAKSLQTLKINIELKSKDKLKNIYCTSHDIDIKRPTDNYAEISYQEKDTKPNTDFFLYFTTENSKIGTSLITYKNKNEDGFFYLDISPGININNNEIEPKNITFVLDTSGSMAGEKLDQAKKALLFCINNLNKNDHFEIIRFSTEAEPLFGSLESINENKNLEKAKLFISNLKAIGGTNIEEALSLALKNSGNSSRPHLVIFITDGKPTIGETEEDKLLAKVKKSNVKNTRIFTFGIGNEINTHLLDKITEATRAYRSYILPDEDIEVKVSNFYTKVQSPVLTDIKLDFDKKVTAFNIYPKELPDLFYGDSLNIIGRYKSGGKTKIILTGILKGKKESFSFDLNFPYENTLDEFIPPLWASRRIGYLLDQIRLHGEEKELIEEIVTLARTYGIVTPYTSYLIVEDELTRTEANDLDRRYQTLNNFMPKKSKNFEESKKEFFGMQNKSGEKSVQASKELQSLSSADNYNKIYQGKERLDIKDSEGNIKNLSEIIKNVQGRAVYQTDNIWIDSQIQNERKLKTVKIKFASKEYFELLKNNSEASQFLSLGKNVRFVLNGNIYEILE